MDVIDQLCDKKIEWTTLKGMPFGGTYVGLDEIFGNYFPNMLCQILMNFMQFHKITSNLRTM